MRNAVIGNILSLEAYCKDKLKEYNLISQVVIDGKLDKSEKMKEIIKFSNPSNKLVNKILVIAQDDEKNLCFHLMKMYGEVKMSFPLEIVDSYQIYDEKGRKENLIDFKEIFVIKLKFIEQICWEDMILAFLNAESFKRFEEVYNEFNENRVLSRKKFSLQDNKSKIQNTYKEKKNTIWCPNPVKSNNKDPNIKKKSLLDDVINGTFKM